MFMAITTHLKILAFILFCSSGFYGLYPFINGSGCDFYAEAEDEFRKVNMTCFAGQLTSVYQKKLLEIFWFLRGYGVRKEIPSMS